MNAGQAAAGSSISSVGLQTYATLLQAQGTATADTFQADRLTTAAKYGEVKADQTGAQATRNLTTTLGNIDAVHAAAHSDPSSPTGAAFRDNQEMIGNQQRGIAVGNIDAQNLQDLNDAACYRQASNSALLSGDISAAAGVFKAVAGIPRLGSAAGGAAKSAVGDPNGIGGLY
jgi:hypothetical protein